MLTKEDLKEIFDSLTIEESKSWVERLTQNLFIPNDRFWSILRVPFFKFLLEKLDDPTVEIISLMCSSQIGKSIFLCGVAIEWALKYPGENVLFYCPDNGNAKLFMEKYMLPCIYASNEYSKNLPKHENGEYDRKSITKSLIKFINGSTIEVLGIAGHNATVSRNASLVIADEFSSAKTLRKNGGDLISLLSRRLTSKAYNPHKLLIASTPLSPDKDIHKLWKESRQYEWNFECPECKTHQPLEFRNLKWKNDKELGIAELSDNVLAGKTELYFECPHCKRKIYESEKIELLANGKEVIVGNPDIVSRVCLKLNGLYTFEKWGKYASDFIQTKDNIKKLMEFNTQVLCEPWNPFGGDKLISRKDFKKGSYKKGTIPEDTHKLICGIDVQGNRYYYTVWAITRQKKLCLVDYGMPDFNITDPYNVDSLPYQMASRTYGGLRISKIIIDVGFSQNIIMKICRDVQAIPLKGCPKSRYANQYLYKKEDPEIRFCPLQETNGLFDDLLLQETLEFPENMDLGEEIVEHFLNVIKVKGSYKDKFDGARRDYRDCSRYALSYIFSQNLHGEIDRQEYVKNNQENIKQKARQNSARLAQIFS